MTRFNVLAVTASNSRNGGANIRCQEVSQSVFGEVLGREFIMQTNTIPGDEIVGNTFDMNLKFDDVDYTFTKNGETTHVKYTRAIPV